MLELKPNRSFEGYNSYDLLMGDGLMAQSVNRQSQFYSLAVSYIYIREKTFSSLHHSSHFLRLD
jgi:hypothetical protein